MPRQVQDIMNCELFSTRPNESAADVRGYLMALGVSVSPVLGDGDAVLGIVSLRDLVRAPDDERVRDHMTAPAVTISAGASVDDAARRMAETGHHRLVAVDAEGRAAGIVSSLDIVRSMVGAPIRHPAAS